MDAIRILGAVAGALLICLTLLDVVWTALTAKGTGPIARRLSSGSWKVALRLHRRWPDHRRLGMTGVLLLVLSCGAWVLLLWLGWSLVFMGDLEAIVAAQSRVPASWWERVYFAGFSITTLGVGDYVANGPLWRAMSILAAISGFSVLTLGVTYLLSLLPALARKRALAMYLHALGGTPARLVGDRCREGDALLPHVPTLMEMLETLLQEHAAFPNLHYFHADSPAASLALRIAALHEALLYLDAGPLHSEETALGLAPLRRSVDSFIVGLDDRYLAKDSDPPDPPPLPELGGRLRPAHEDGLARAAAARAQQRRSLLRFVRHSGWTWQEMYAGAQRDAPAPPMTGTTNTQEQPPARLASAESSSDDRMP